MLNKYKQTSFIHGAITLILFSFSLSLQAFDRQQINSNSILIKTILEAESYLEENKRKYPKEELNGLEAWIDDSELKWSNSDIGDFEAQKLSFEVKLKNTEQIYAEQEILNMGQSKIALKFGAFLEKRLKSTYFSLIDYMSKKSRKKLLQQQRVITHSELNHWKLKVNSNDFRADKLQQVDLTLEGVWADELENDTSLNRYNNQYIVDTNEAVIDSIQYTEDATKNTAGLVSISHMLEIVQDIIQNKKFQRYNSLIQKAKLNINLIKRQKQRNNAQEKLSLNSFKLEYDNKDNDLGFSIGIKIPITKNNYESLLQAQMQHYASIGVQQVMLEISDQLTEKQYQLMSLQDQWLINQKLLHKINIRFKRLSRTNNIGLLLDLKKERLQRKVQQEEIKTQALKKYIDILYTAGMLSVKPYRNWIQSGIPRIL